MPPRTRYYPFRTNLYFQVESDWLVCDFAQLGAKPVPKVLPLVRKDKSERSLGVLKFEPALLMAVVANRHEIAVRRFPRFPACIPAMMHFQIFR